MDAPAFLLTDVSAPEKLARDRLTYAAWGKGLTRDQYLARERLLRQTDHGRLAMRTWALRVPNGTILATCETFRLPLLPTGSLEVIASVFVDGPLRGVRMASRLMQALVAHRREAGLDGLVLFSEVGETLYARAGFRTLPSPSRSWPARTSDTTARRLLVTERQEAFDWRNAQRAERIDLKLLDQLFDWHLERSLFYAQHLPRLMTEHIGARAGDVQALWVPDFKSNVLRVLDVTGPAGASLEPVMQVAADEAARLGLTQVDLWDDAVSATLVGGTSAPRDNDLPMGIAFTPRGELFLGPLSRACWA
jgi:N-acetylglutamate synthase-like GNAT family acetyltransferase